MRKSCNAVMLGALTAVLITLAIACAEVTEPSPRHIIRAQVQVSSGVTGRRNEIKALQEILTRRSALGRPAEVHGYFGGKYGVNSLPTLIGDARALTESSNPGAQLDITTHGLQPKFAPQSGSPTIRDAYTLASLPVSDGGTGLVFAHMYVVRSTSSYGDLDQKVHVTTERAGQKLIDMNATGSAGMVEGSIEEGLDTRVDVQMSQCDALNASTAHHFHDKWDNTDYWAATADLDAPEAGCCDASNDSTPPAASSVTAPNATFVKLRPAFSRYTGSSAKAFSPLSLSATPFSEMKLSSPTIARVETQTCSTGTSGGGGGGGGGGSGYHVVYCLMLEHYDGDGNLLYTETVSCWTEYYEM